MPGAPDALYVGARRVLLDALEALREHLPALVLVGAQAVYLHAGEADLAIAPFTTDGDLALDPRRLASEPLLEEALGRQDFRPGHAVGNWVRSTDVRGRPHAITVDLLVPESMGGAGRRAARIPPHAKTAARKAAGLEAVLVDNDGMTIQALERSDARRFEIAVAGPAALLVAKVHKILDRAESTDRVRDKDALDVYRLLRALPTDELVRRFLDLWANDISGEAAAYAAEEFPRLFGSATAIGVGMAVRAAAPLERGDTLAASFAVLANDLIDALRNAR